MYMYVNMYVYIHVILVCFSPSFIAFSWKYGIFCTIACFTLQHGTVVMRIRTNNSLEYQPQGVLRIALVKCVEQRFLV